MVWTGLTVYLAGWIVAAVAIFLAGKRLCEPGMPAGNRIALSVAAGVIWPVLLLGMAEYGSMAAYSSAHAAVSHESLEPVDGHGQFEQTLAGVTQIR